MERRALLLKAGTATALGIASAGCTDDSGTSDADAGGSDSGGSETGDATEHIDQARDYLDEGVVMLEEESEDSDPFRPDRVTRRTDSARSELEMAREGASDDELAVIDQLELLADELDEFALGYESLGELFNDLDTIDALIAAERFDEAGDEVETASDRVNDIQNRVQNIEGIYDEIDPEIYDDFDELNRADMEEWVVEMEELLDGLALMFDAFGSMLTGMSDFMDGVDEWEDESWGRAAARFEDAADEFDDSASQVAAGEAEAPSQFRSEFIELGCLVESLRDASEHYADAMDHASNEEWNAAEESIDDGDRALDSC